MKNAIGFAAKVLFYAMVAVLLVLNASYTMSFVSVLFPADWIKIWGSLILFDAGAIIWFLMFLTKAEGAGQRGAALLLGVIDLVGSLIIAGAEVFGASETFLSDPTMAMWLRETATYVLFIWLGINIAGTWLYHVMDPKQQVDMKARAIQDEITEKALNMAASKVNAISADLADELSEDFKLQVLAALNITNRALLPTPRRDFIDVKAHDAPRQEDEEEEKPRKKRVGRSANLRPATVFRAEAPTAGKAAEANVRTSTEDSDDPTNSIAQDGNSGANFIKPRKGR